MSPSLPWSPGEDTTTRLAQAAGAREATLSDQPCQCHNGESALVEKALVFECD